MEACVKQMVQVTRSIPCLSRLPNVRFYGKRQESRPWKQKPNRRPRIPLILTEKVDNLGTRGDLVHVKRGYGRNFLLPTGKAVYANHETRKEFGVADIKKGRQAKDESRPTLNVEKLTEFLMNKKLVIEQDSKMYNWAIHETHISTAFARQLQLHVPVDCIELANPLCDYGVANVSVILSEDDTKSLEGSVRVSVPVEIIDKSIKSKSIINNNY